MSSSTVFIYQIASNALFKIYQLPSTYFCLSHNLTDGVLWDSIMARTLASESGINYSNFLTALAQEKGVTLQTFAETYALPLLKSLFTVLNASLNQLPYDNVPLGNATLADLGESMDTGSVTPMVGDRQQNLKDLIKFDEAGCIILLCFIALAACLVFALLGTGGGGGGGGGEKIIGGPANNQKKSAPVDCNDFTDPAAWIVPRCMVKGKR